MKTIIFLTILISSAWAQDSTAVQKHRQAIIESFSRDLQWASGIQLGSVSFSGITALVAYDRLKKGRPSELFWYLSAGGGFAGLLIPPLFIKKAAIRINGLNKIEAEIKF